LSTQVIRVGAGLLYGELADDILEGKRKYTMIERVKVMIHWTTFRAMLLGHFPI